MTVAPSSESNGVDGTLLTTRCRLDGKFHRMFIIAQALLQPISLGK